MAGHVSIVQGLFGRMWKPIGIGNFKENGTAQNCDSFSVMSLLLIMTLKSARMAKGTGVDSKELTSISHHLGRNLNKDAIFSVGKARRNRPRR